MLHDLHGCKSTLCVLLMVLMVVNQSRDNVLKSQAVFDIVVEYTKEQQLYRILVPSGHIFLTFCIRIGTFDRYRVFGLL